MPPELSLGGPMTARSNYCGLLCCDMIGGGRSTTAPPTSTRASASVCAILQVFKCASPRGTMGRFSLRGIATPTCSSAPSRTPTI
jgi:hypothetical protein